jgi:hypothetical protein
MLHVSRVFFGGLFAFFLAGSLAAEQAAAPSGSGATRSKLDRLIETFPVEYPLPASTCVVPLMTPLIAAAVGMSAGVESLPEACRRPTAAKPNVQPERLTFTGMTGREAIARLTELDPRYSAIETDGVLVMRPVSAWNDTQHFLHQHVPQSPVQAANFNVAAVSVYHLWSRVRLPPDNHPGPTPQGQQPISFDIKASAYETLNSIVRVHGAMVWSIRYCSAPPRAEFASLFFHTIDGSGTGVIPPGPADANGRQTPAMCLPLDGQPSGLVIPH